MKQPIVIPFSKEMITDLDKLKEQEQLPRTIIVRRAVKKYLEENLKEEQKEGQNEHRKNNDSGQ